jgi:hypothetical protein
MTENGIDWIIGDLLTGRSLALVTMKDAQPASKQSTKLVHSSGTQSTLGMEYPHSQSTGDYIATDMGDSRAWVKNRTKAQKVDSSSSVLYREV